MSLGVVVKGPEGVVLAADTRVTINAQSSRLAVPILVNFDNATKLLTFGDKHNFVAAVTYGDAIIGGRTASSFLPELAHALGEARLSVFEYAMRVSSFFLDRWKEAGKPTDEAADGMKFILAGYNESDPYGEVYVFNVPNAPDPIPQKKGTQFGMNWGGQLDIASRLIHGYDPILPSLMAEQLDIPQDRIEDARNALQPKLEHRIPFGMLPLQDCVDLATFLVRTTITAQRFAITVRGVGGSIDVVAITRTKGVEWIQRRDLHGEV